MGGLNIIAKNKKGEIKQDLNIQRDNKSKVVEVNKLKEKEDERRRVEGNSKRSKKTA